MTRCVLATVFALGALAYSSCWTGSSDEVGKLEPRFDPNINYGKIEAGTSIRLTLDAFDRGGTSIGGHELRKQPVIGWYLQSTDDAAPRQPEADAAVELEAAHGDRSPQLPLRSVPDSPWSIDFLPPFDSYGLLVVRAVVAADDCADSDTVGQAAQWDGPCSAEFIIRVVPPAAPVLRAFLGGGGSGEVLLEWTVAEPGATRWQYRERLRNVRFWGDWTDIPGSNADTRNHRVTGLTARRIYLFQVRPWTSVGASEAYEATQVITALDARTDGIPRAEPGQLLESGQRFRYGLCAFVVPQGMHLRMGGVTSIGPQYSGWPGAFVLEDVQSRAAMLVHAETCEVVHQEVLVLKRYSIYPFPRGRDIEMLFTQIADSLEQVSTP